MAIVAKTFLDHITIQFAYGGEHQLAKPGEVEGAHFAEIEYLVDDATGAVVGKTQNKMNGTTQVLDPAKVSDMLGAKFATFVAQLADTQAELDTTKTAVTDRDAQIAEQKAQIDQLTKAHADITARNAAAALALQAD